MGIEPTGDPCEPLTGFEDRGTTRHQSPPLLGWLAVGVAVEPATPMPFDCFPLYRPARRLRVTFWPHCRTSSSASHQRRSPARPIRRFPAGENPPPAPVARDISRRDRSGPTPKGRWPSPASFSLAAPRRMAAPRNSWNFSRRLLDAPPPQPNVSAIWTARRHVPPLSQQFIGRISSVRCVARLRTLGLRGRGRGPPGLGGRLRGGGPRCGRKFAPPLRPTRGRSRQPRPCLQRAAGSRTPRPWPGAARSAIRRTFGRRRGFRLPPAPRRPWPPGRQPTSLCPARSPRAGFPPPRTGALRAAGARRRRRTPRPPYSPRASTSSGQRRSR